MKAMILAAGRGTRLRPLTDTCPKPLVKLAQKPLIVYHIENLKKAGISDIIINVSYLAHQIIDFLGDGKHWDVKITYSVEEQPLEVGGGICTALPLLGNSPFIILNSDIWTDFPLSHLSHHTLEGLAHLILVPNPNNNLKGDFKLQGKFISQDASINDYTYSGIAYLHPQLFAECSAHQILKLPPLIVKAARNQQVTGEIYQGQWTDVGTLERLETLEKKIANNLTTGIN